MKTYALSFCKPMLKSTSSEEVFLNKVSAAFC